MMNRNSWWVSGTAVVATAFGVSLLMHECHRVEAAFDPCANRQLQVVRSPDGKRKAVIFERDCGATTGFSTQVSVLPSGARLPNEPGNAFVADTDHGATPSGPGGGPAIKVIWTSNTKLLIKHHPKARLFKAHPQVAGVTIRYAR
jgi:hypothetical protein